MSALLWMLFGIVWISDGLPARGRDISGWREGEDKDLVLEKRKAEGEGRYVLPYRMPEGGNWQQPGSRGPVYAKATCTSVPGRVVCHLGRYTFVINNGDHKMEPEVIERFAAMLYHRTQEGDTNFDVAVETPPKEETLCAEAPGEPLQTRDLSDESPVYVECSPVREERRGEVVYSCRRHGLGKRGTVLVVGPEGTVADGQYVLPFRRIIEKRSALEENTGDLKIPGTKEADSSQGSGSSVNVSELAPIASSDGSQDVQAEQFNSSLDRISSSAVDPSKNKQADRSSIASENPSLRQPDHLSPVASADRSSIASADRSPSASFDQSPVAPAELSPIASADGSQVIPVDRSRIVQAGQSPSAQADRSPSVQTDRSPYAETDKSSNSQADRSLVIQANQSSNTQVDQSSNAQVDKSSKAQADRSLSAPGNRSPIATADRPLIPPAERSPSVIGQAETSDSMPNKNPMVNISIEMPSPAVASGAWAKMEAEHKAINSQSSFTNQVPIGYSMPKLHEVKNNLVNENVSKNYEKEAQKENDSFKKSNEGLILEATKDAENKNIKDAIITQGHWRTDESQDKISNAVENDLKQHFITPNYNINKNDENRRDAEYNINMHENSNTVNEITPNYDGNANKLKNMEGILYSGGKSQNEQIMANSKSIKAKDTGLKNSNEIIARRDNEISSDPNESKNIEVTATDNNKDVDFQHGNTLGAKSNEIKYMSRNLNNPSNVNKELISGQPKEIPSYIDKLRASEQKVNRAMSANQNMDGNAVEKAKISENNKMEINLNSNIKNRDSSNTKIISGKANIGDGNIKELHNEKTHSDVNSFGVKAEGEKGSVIEVAANKEISPQAGLDSQILNDAKSIKKNSNFTSNHAENIIVSSSVIGTSKVESKKDSINDLKKNSVQAGFGSDKLKATGPLTRLDETDNSDSKIPPQADMRSYMKNNGERPNVRDAARSISEGLNRMNNRQEKVAKPILAQDMFLSKNINSGGNVNSKINENINSNVSSRVNLQVLEKDSSKNFLKNTPANNKVGLNAIIDYHLRQIPDLIENPSFLGIEGLPFPFGSVKTDRHSDDIDKTFVLNIDTKEFAGFPGPSEVKNVLMEANIPSMKGSLDAKQDIETPSGKMGHHGEDAFALPTDSKDLQENLARAFQRNLPPPRVRNFSDTCYNDFMPGFPWCPNTPVNTECPFKGCVTRCEDNENPKWQGPGSRRKRQEQGTADHPKKRQVFPTGCSSPTSPCPTTSGCPSSPTVPSSCPTTTCRVTPSVARTPASCPPLTTNCSNANPPGGPPPASATSCGPPLDPPGEVPPCFKPPPLRPGSPAKTTSSPRLQRRAVRGRHSAKKKKKMALRQAAAKGIKPEEYLTVYS